MKQLRIFLVVAVLMSAVAKFTGFVSDNVSLPILLFSVAGLLATRSLDYKKEGDKVGVFIMAAAAIFLAITAIVGMVYN